VFDFFRTLFKPIPSSGATAKERLRLVLLSDHLSLAPEVVDALKREILAVISRYVEIDNNHADVTFEYREREVAMLASIPITGVRDRPRPLAPSLGAGPQPLEDPAPVEEPAPAAPPPESEPKPAPVRASNGAQPRRRRRKKASGIATPAGTPQTAAVHAAQA